jgi:hypothetical protein
MTTRENPTNQLINLLAAVDGLTPELGARMLLLAVAMISVAPRGFDAGSPPDIFSLDQLVSMLREAHAKAITVQRVILGLRADDDPRVGPTGRTGMP